MNINQTGGGGAPVPGKPQSNQAPGATAPSLQGQATPAGGPGVRDSRQAASQALEDVAEVIYPALPFDADPSAPDLARLGEAIIEARHDDDPSNDGIWQRAWANGADLNHAVSQGYARSADELRAVLGPGVTTPVWMDFGKFASHEAGATYVMMQAAVQVLENLQKNPLALVTDAWNLAANVANSVTGSPGMRQQVQALLTHVFKEQGGLANLAGLAAMTAIPGVGPVLAAQRVKDFLGETSDTVRNLGQTLLEGNLMIQANFGPAMEAFTQAEAAGQDGVAAAEAWLAGMKPPGDPTGLFAAGLKKYQDAADLSRLAESKASPEREELLARANALVQDGNRLLAAHEQNLVRPLYEQDKVHALMQEMTPHLSVRDPNHPGNAAYELLPGGGNWADYATRMGLEKLPDGRAFVANGHANGIIEVLGPDGKTKEYYRFLPQPPEGTIPHYFGTAVGGEAARKVIEGEIQKHEVENIAVASNPVTTVVEAAGAVKDQVVDTVDDAVGAVAETVGDVKDAAVNVAQGLWSKVVG